MRCKTLLTALALLANGTALAASEPDAPAHDAEASADREDSTDPEDEDLEYTGYHEVYLKDRGPHVMEDMRDYHHLVMVTPLFIPLGAKVRYHHAINDRSSLIVGLGYAGLGTADGSLVRTHLRAGLDLHPIGNGMSGFYLGPRITRNTWKMRDCCGEGESLHTVGGSAVLGYRWITDPGLTVGLGAGAGYTAVHTSGADEDYRSLSGTTVVLAGTHPVVEFTLGLAF